MTADFDRAALVALAGDRDHVNTVLAWMLALDGRLVTINKLIEERNLSLVAVARLFDGLDGHEVCDAMEQAFDVLGLYEKALTP